LLSAESQQNHYWLQLALAPFELLNMDGRQQNTGKCIPISSVLPDCRHNTGQINKTGR
jgi:hypothetical protein